MDGQMISILQQQMDCGRTASYLTGLPFNRADDRAHAKNRSRHRGGNDVCAYDCTWRKIAPPRLFRFFSFK